MYRHPRLAILRGAVNPSRKRKIRLGVALSVAVLLAVALIYVSFNASSDTAEPTQIMAASAGQKYEMNATVVPGSIKHKGETIDFEVEDREGGNAMPVSYTGVVPIRSAAAARSSSPARGRLAEPSSANRNR